MDYKLFKLNQTNQKIEQVLEENLINEPQYLYWCRGLDSWYTFNDFKSHYLLLKQKREEFLKTPPAPLKVSPEEKNTLKAFVEEKKKDLKKRKNKKKKSK